MTESAPTIIAVVVVAAVGGYLGYRVCKEKNRLGELVAMLGPGDLDLIRSLEKLTISGELEPTTA